MNFDSQARKPVEQYVDMDRWAEAVQQLFTTKAKLLDACDKADYAARQAGTPIRTHHVRLNIEALAAEIRSIEAKMQLAAAGERSQPNRSLRKVEYPSFAHAPVLRGLRKRTKGLPSLFEHPGQTTMANGLASFDDQSSTRSLRALRLALGATGPVSSGDRGRGNGERGRKNNLDSSSKGAKTVAIKLPKVSGDPLDRPNEQVAKDEVTGAFAHGEAAARLVTAMLASDKSSLSADDCDRLLNVISAKGVDAGSARLTNFSIAFFRSMSPKHLTELVSQLVDESGDFRPSSEKRQATARLLQELNRLFGASLHDQTDVTTGQSAWAAYIKKLDPNCLNGLLQGDHRGTSKISAANIAFLAELALPNPHSMYGFRPVRFDGQSARSLRLTVLDLLSDDQKGGGEALMHYLTPGDKTVASMKIASERLLAILNPDRLHEGVFQPGSSEAEDQVAAKLMERFFVLAFDGASISQAKHAGEVLELAIANTTQLKSTPPIMLRALATGLAGAMINPEVAIDLLVAGANGAKNQSGRADLIHAHAPGIDPSVLDFGDFIQRLCSDRKATGQIVAALGPMIASQAKALNQLPDGDFLMGGTGFILGSILRKFDKDAELRRTIYDAIGVGLTVTFAALGGAVSGPTGGVAAGALGSGILQNISALIDVKTKSAGGIPTDEKSVRRYLKAVYISATFKWLEPTVQTQILSNMDTSNEQGSDPKAEFEVLKSGELCIRNIAVLSEDRLRRLTDAIIRGALSPIQGRETEGQRTINRFGQGATDESAMAR